MCPRLCAALSLGCLLMLSPPGASAALPQYRAQVLWPPGDIQAADINNAGQIAANLGGTFDVRHAFLYDHGQAIDLPFPYQPSNSGALAINERGDLVGMAQFNDKALSAFYYHAGQLTDISSSLAPGEFGQAVAINNHGQAVGQANRKMFIFDGATSRYVETPIPARPSDINDYGVVVGQLSNDVPFLYSNSHFHNLSLSTCQYTCEGAAQAINNVGQIVGGVRFGDDRFPVLWTRDSFTSMGRLATFEGLQWGQAYDINDHGWAVGESAIDAYHRHGFLYLDGRMHDLNALLTSGAGTRWEITIATDINDKGQILASANRVGDPWRTGYQLLLSPVPEPSDCVLFLFGMAAVGASARRSRGLNKAWMNMNPATAAESAAAPCTGIRFYPR